MEEKLHTLHRLLLRVRIIVEEAEGRCITNQAMICQLNILRKEMYRGYYTLDSFRTQANRADLGNYHPLYPQPYSMHLLLDRCVFGRQMELERVMDFLRQTKSPGTETSVDILPIVGPVHVGKSTLVSNVCNNENVRNLFSQILLVGEDDLRRRSQNANDDGHMTKQPNGALTEKEYSKIIITSRSSKILDFGTVQPLVLSDLPREAFWYFFKVLTFGSADPKEQPKLSSITMELVMGMKQSFGAANMLADLLRCNLDVQFWRRTVKLARRYVQANISEFGEHPCALVWQNRPTRLVVAEIGIVVSETYAAMAACQFKLLFDEEQKTGASKPRKLGKNKCTTHQPIMKLNDLPVAAVSAEQGEK
ncbi:uncharacterized protein LOC112270731 [Brachypodium distachyon]|uniref:uncharacterized protein LOC112270731 n=1 Tax=Brachypodium distachyon TaxID=15368 RepID=UPI000D0DF0F6|nr:uncharacterized protein LOC112270731 [Brachypodium distachyon]|eukprot:XP_024314564.1 uncharacterized protein LOC112270731 [Brachypodium distachyon]